MLFRMLVLLFLISSGTTFDALTLCCNLCCLYLMSDLFAAKESKQRVEKELAVYKTKYSASVRMCALCALLQGRIAQR